ncbi:DUF1569 domain-containing protein [bacterium]|nr:DUF1569 domain-containing protein [bacterium]
MEKKNLLDLDVYEAAVQRIQKLTPTTAAEWGKMDAAQMMAHCAETIDVANGKPLKGTPWYVSLFGWYIKKMVLSDKPYPKNLRTHPQYLMSDPEDFERQKQRLLNSLKAMIALGRVNSTHSLFGIMTPEEKGWGMYKHLDHHLSQFGV